MATLKEIYKKYSAPDGSGDKGTAHTYIDNVYGPVLESRRNEIGRLLEIGVGLGYSIKMWREYFPKADVIGVDIKLHKQINVHDDAYKNIYLYEIDATKSEQVETFLSATKFDLIIDDGSHNACDQIATFEILWKKLNSKGIYIIEDVNNVDTISTHLKNKQLGYHFYDGRHIKNRNDDCAFIIYKNE